MIATGETTTLVGTVMDGRSIAFGIASKAFPRQPVGGTHGSADAEGPLTIPALIVGVRRGEGKDLPPSSGWPARGPGHVTGADALA